MHTRTHTQVEKREDDSSFMQLKEEVSRSPPPNTFTHRSPVSVCLGTAFLFQDMHMATLIVFRILNVQYSLGGLTDRLFSLLAVSKQLILSSCNHRQIVCPGRIMIMHIGQHGVIFVILLCLITCMAHNSWNLKPG